MKSNKLGNILTLSSFNNTLVKKIKKLKVKNSKRNDIDFVAEGEFFLNEAILNNWLVSDLLLSSKTKDIFFKTQIYKKLSEIGTNIFFADYEIFKRILKKDNPQDFLFIIKKKENVIPKRIKKNYLSLVLENIRDPGNMGTIFRTAESFGVNHCFLLGETVNPYSIEVIRASAGSIFNLTFSFISERGIADWFNNNNIHVIGTSPNSNVLHENFLWKMPLSLAIGNEQNGLSEFLTRECSHILTISTKGKTKSLNVGVASGIFMESIFRKFPTLD